jgi:hypothetical protein
MQNHCRGDIVDNAKMMPETKQMVIEWLDNLTEALTWDKGYMQRHKRCFWNQNNPPRTDGRQTKIADLGSIQGRAQNKRQDERVYGLLWMGKPKGAVFRVGSGLGWSNPLEKRRRTAR